MSGSPRNRLMAETEEEELDAGWTMD
jgi:hypothetical protein